VRSPVGWHILLVDRVEPGRTPSFAETRAKIREDLAREQAVDAVVKLANQVEDTLAGGATLEEAARQVNAKLLRFRSVEQSGRSADGDPEDGLLVLRRFLQAAFETNATEVSDLIETSLGGYFLVRVDRVVPPALEPFDFIPVAFETVSAFSTTGFSTGITPDLSAGGKIVLIFAMFIGRLGPLTVVLALARHRGPSEEIEAEEEPIRIG